MKPLLLLASLILLSGAVALAATPPAQPRPKIEVAFVLDTTGSMSGLIEGAKAKIWAIANQIVTSTDPRPDIRIALIGYRDRNDEYVTRVFDLTDDLDTVFQHLQGFSAHGGGDTPESVNQALHEAVTQLSWSDGPDVAKIIFLVGDAPPHMDYPDDVKYPEVCQLAVRKNLVINTIQCGSETATTPIWQEIARRAEGAFVQIEQSGNMAVVATPLDDDIADVSRELGKTVLAYGEQSEQEATRQKVASPGRAPTPVAADRALFNLASGGRAVQGRGDLLTDLAGGSVKLEDLKADTLPAELQGKSVAEQRQIIEKNQQRRDELNLKLAELTRRREEYLRQQQQRAGTDAGDTFDRKVAEIVREQAGRKLATTRPTAAPADR